MKLASVQSLIAAAILALGMSVTASEAFAHSKCCGTSCKDQCCKASTLEQALAGRQLSDGWNRVVIVAGRNDVVYAEVSGGKIVAWQVKSADGKDLRTHVRNAENPDNLRLTWEPETGPGRFLEAPATVIRP
ncbi:MAG: hypothetical protein ACAI35_11240 [Candidatus Methylacidiphilales bacterium]|nr:hypothetical protein [Candidatus Methylacidiphilales bacterium]